MKENAQVMLELIYDFYFLYCFQIPAQFVESMLEVHQKYTELIQSVFQTDQQFVGALDKVCLFVEKIKNCLNDWYIEKLST